jgi:hypothetical protein
LEFLIPADKETYRSGYQVAHLWEIDQKRWKGPGQ